MNLSRVMIVMLGAWLLSACVYDGRIMRGFNPLEYVECKDRPKRYQNTGECRQNRPWSEKSKTKDPKNGSISGSSSVREIEAVRFDYERPITEVTIQYRGHLSVEVFTIPGVVCKVVVDFSRAEFDLPGAAMANGQRQVKGDGIVTRYRYAQNDRHTSRIVFDLEKPALVEHKFETIQGNRNRRVLVMRFKPTTYELFQVQSRTSIFSVSSIDPDSEPNTATAARAPVRAATARVAPAPRNSDDDRPVIVIDAGHGGRDPGATGGAGLREKEVNLAVATRLAQRLERTGRYRVVMTRADDRFLSLEDRLAIARREQGDLFLSIHADSLADNTNARGASVYTLSDRGAGRARRELRSTDQDWIGDVDLRGRPQDISDILFDLAQRDTNNQSAVFAQTLLPRLDEAGPLLRNSHRSAGFYVLLAPDVPAVLVEMGFLSNPDDERLLKTDRHRARLAAALAGAIDDYFADRASIVAQR